jgi:hypothetical protein
VRGSDYLESLQGDGECSNCEYVASVRARLLFVAACTLIPCHGDVLRCFSHASTFSFFVLFVR